MKALLLAFLLAQGGDLATTAAGLSRACHHEANPVLHGAAIGRIAAVKSGAMAGEITIAWGAHRNGHSTSARVLLWTGVATGAFATVWNARQLSYGCP